MAYRSDRKACIKRLKLLVYNAKENIDLFREKIEKEFSVAVLPNRVECKEANFGGVICDLLSPEIFASNKIMLYIHGGSFVAGSRSSWRSFCARLATKSFCKIVLPEFRLPPAHPYPAPLEDVQSVFQTLYLKGNDDIVVAADGSGASLALALILGLSERHRAAISKLLLLSPWLDFTDGSHLENGKKKSDELIQSATLSKCGAVYTYASNLKNMFVSPLCAASEAFAGFPETYIQYGENELLKNDYKRLQEILRVCNVTCTLDEWKNMMMFFQFADELLWETHLAIEKLGNYISETKKNTNEISFENKPPLEQSIRHD